MHITCLWLVKNRVGFTLKQVKLRLTLKSSCFDTAHALFTTFNPAQVQTRTLQQRLASLEPPSLANEMHSSPSFCCINDHTLCFFLSIFDLKTCRVLIPQSLPIKLENTEHSSLFVQLRQRFFVKHCVS